jgi:hypothetical protein
MVALVPIGGSAVPVFADGLDSESVLAPTAGEAGLTVLPRGGCVASCGANSAAFVALNGIDATNACVCAAWVEGSMGRRSFFMGGLEVQHQRRRVEEAMLIEKGAQLQRHSPKGS